MRRPEVDALAVTAARMCELAADQLNAVAPLLACLPDEQDDPVLYAHYCTVLDSLFTRAAGYRRQADRLAASEVSRHSWAGPVLDKCRHLRLRAQVLEESYERLTVEA